MFRDLLDKLDSLVTESRGIGARVRGAEFVSTTNSEEKIYIDEVKFYPESGGQYPDETERNTVLKDIVENFKGTIRLIKEFTPRDLAFGLVVFTRADSEERLAFVKPFRQVTKDPAQNQWDNQTGIPGYKFNSKSAAKTQAGVTPQDVLQEKNDLTPADIVGQIEKKFGAQSTLTIFAKAVAAGQPFPITLPADPTISFEAFRDYFCELLHPVALQTGRFEGNAQDAAKKFIGRTGFNGTKINFGTDKTEGLSDSKMVAPNGRSLKISSKGDKGAQASSKNLLDSIEELRRTDPDIVTRHAEMVELISTIKTAGQYLAPLLLGKKYGIIEAEDVDFVKGLRGADFVSLDNLPKEGMSRKLITLVKNRKTKNPDEVNLYIHSISAVAHAVADYVNENTKFGKSACEILNNAALVQVYTIGSKKKDQWVVEKFVAHYPSNTTTGVEFRADKNYMSTQIKGNFTFYILRNGATAPKDDSSEIQDQPDQERDVEPAPEIRPRGARGAGRSTKGVGRATR